jgi:hypothetical protein
MDKRKRERERKKKERNAGVVAQFP